MQLIPNMTRNKKEKGEGVLEDHGQVVMTTGGMWWWVMREYILCIQACVCVYMHECINDYTIVSLHLLECYEHVHRNVE